MHARQISSRVATGALALALGLGGLAVTGGAAQAAPSSGDRAASAECQQARKDLSKAKKQLRKAKRSGKAAKVRKAKHRVQVRKNQKERACAPATEESVLQQVQRGQLALDGLDLSTVSGALPPELAAGLAQLLAQLAAALDTIGASVPGADAAELEALRSALEAMDVQGVVSALQGIAGQLTGLVGGPEALATLIQMLQGGLPGGDSVPIQGIPDLQVLLGQLGAQLGGLGGGLDPVGATAQVQAAIAQLVATLESIAENVGGPSAGWLAALTDMVDQLGELGALTPGAAGSGDVLHQVIGTLLFFAQPGSDPLAQLQGILAGGSLAGVLDLIGLGDLIGSVLDGVLGGVLGTPAA